jgi:diphthamide biosynthesis protein 3
MIYSPEIVAALSKYKLHLRGTGERLEERKKMAVEELKALGDPEVSNTGMEMDGGDFDDFKGRYGGLLKEVELLKADIARLEQ